MIKITSDNIKVWKNEMTNNEGETRVYYTYSIASKITDNSYEYMSKPIKFKRDCEPSETCNIKINNAFQSFYKKGEEKVDYLMVLDYEIIDEEKHEPIENYRPEITDDDLPF